MSPDESSFYAQWRLQCGKPVFLGESHSPLPERLLQVIWYHQRLLRDQLRTLDGRPVRVLHPGFWNHEAGPDFRGAFFQIGNEAPKTGDVEIDLQTSGWHHHGHDRNPNFQNVLLHVVWRADGDAENGLPTMALEPFLDAPLNELSHWLGSDSARQFPGNLAGNCCAPLMDLPEGKLEALLRQAAFIRFQRKANELQARARQAGWDQALWEGIFRALGYKQNVWPMQRLGELCRLARMETIDADTPRSWQARLFGLSGLLPSQPDEVKDDAYLRAIWDIWWRERDVWHDSILPRTLWRFSGLRPANLPQRRLALAAHWLANDRFISDLENWFTRQDPGGCPVESLLKTLHVIDDPFWNWRWTFRSAHLPQAQPLIGPARVSDLAINVLLPWFWSRAAAGKNESLQRRAEELYFAWPAGEDNRVFRLARQRLFGGKMPPRQMRTAAAQQGLLQIVRDFCEHSNAVCLDCRFPDLVRGWNLRMHGAG